jgi:hypothetical protein
LRNRFKDLSRLFKISLIHWNLLIFLYKNIGIYKIVVKHFSPHRLHAAKDQQQSFTKQSLREDTIPLYLVVPMRHQALLDKEACAMI